MLNAVTSGEPLRSHDGFLFGIVSIWSPEWHDVNADSGYACVKWYEEKGKVCKQ